MKKWLLALAMVVLSMGVMTACGAPTEEDPLQEDPMMEEEPGIEDPAVTPEDDVPMDEPIETDPGAEMEDPEEQIDVDVEGEPTGDELADDNNEDDE
ncbi:hypothetical protein [Bacillus sp. JCM 19034]|uniref:hypothetical protein n=1 Tax=Bacillus sp. JCM 19034 TaxID=1481928 RepID=UPI0007807E8C|nr:hypothetical protein [Bacillus sp. JCM 19034]